MACVTEKSRVVTPPALRLELLSPPGARPREAGTVYLCPVAQRRAERAFNRGLALERGVAGNVA